MSKHNSNIFKKYVVACTATLGALVIICSTLLASYMITYNNKVYPNILVAGVKLSGISQGEAESLLFNSITHPSDINLYFQDQSFTIKPTDIDASYNATASAIEAYNLTRTGNFFVDLETGISLIFHPRNIGIATNIDNDKLNKIVSIISGQVSTDPIEPSATISNKNIIIEKGALGKEVDSKKLAETILTNLYYRGSSRIQIPVNIIDNTLSDEDVLGFKMRAEKLLGKSITMKFEYQTIEIDDNGILKMLDPKSGYKLGTIDEKIQETADKIERESQNPKFVFENGKVAEFQPALEGIKIDRDSLKEVLISNLDTLSGSETVNVNISIPVVKTPPEVTTDKVNNLGIKELIGRGTSTYYHSIPGRVHNVALATSRINGTLVRPGETFSFNQTLGDVSAFTGYQQAYIINEGKTILGDGGGVCQVSSTLFRAVLNAGLPVDERQAHAYRVGYYEQGSSPGFDATVYSPSPDFKFTNDTGNYILIEATADTKNYSLIFELYGTRDGRTSSLSKPVVTNVLAPPEDIYQDDPTLPAGTIKQIDYKAWGAKVTFKYVVIKEGHEIINKTFVSNYKPWAAVYLRGTGPSN